MILFKRADLLQHYLEAQTAKGRQTGFIPTMGALHYGHLELVKRSLHATNLTVCSIFVNPTQFNNATDFAKYPKTTEADIAQLESVGTNVLFLPDVDDIYPDGMNESEKFELGYLESILEGSSRPGHFQGVCQVMKRLLTIVNPHMLFMGQKDYQQCMIVSWLIRQMKSRAQLITAPTVRQPDGLAMSSRNLRLSKAGIKTAAGIFETLQFVKDSLKPGNTGPLLEKATKILTGKGFIVDYIQIASADNLVLTDNWDGRSSLVCLVAAYLEDVRLIDNLMLTPQPVS